MNRVDLLRRLADLADSAKPVIVVTLIEAQGSTPADAGAKMLVTDEGLDCGTVGGGRVEAKALGVAAEMLAEGAAIHSVDWSLKADVGMTCGGRVKLVFENLGVAAWPIVIFGAGHVTQALTKLLVTLPCQVTCIDPRREWLDKLPAGVKALEVENPKERVAQLPDEAFVLCMTKGHQSDLPVLHALFESERVFPYVGVIGSRAKAAVLHKELVELGVPAERLDFHCPIGLTIGSNAPGEIAVSIAAQLLERRDRS